MCQFTVQALFEFCLLLVSGESQGVLFYRSIFTHWVGFSLVLVIVSGLVLKSFSSGFRVRLLFSLIFYSFFFQFLQVRLNFFWPFLVVCNLKKI